MLFAVSFVLMVGGMWVMGLSFNLTGIEGPMFVLGILMVSAALALPFTASALDFRGERSNR